MLYDFLSNFFLNFETSQFKYSNQIYHLRQRYYSNLTFLEQMAKYYGELNFLSKLSFHSSLFISFGIASVISIYSSCLFLLCALPFLWFLESLYQALETRFILLIKDLETSEIQLNQLIENNLVIKKKLGMALEKNTTFIQQLENSEIEIKKLQEKILEKDNNMQKNCALIETTAETIHQITQDFLNQKKEHMKNNNGFLNQLNLASTLLENIQLSLNEIDLIDETIDKSIAFTTNMEEFLKKNFSDSFMSKEESQNDSSFCHR